MKSTLCSPSLSCVLPAAIAFAFVGVLFAAFVPLPAHAAQMRLDDVHQGTLLYAGQEPGTYEAAPRLRTDVDLSVEGLIVRATVRQKFKNDSPAVVDGVYAFPLPENAAVDGLTLRIGQRLIEGEIREKGAARREFEEAKRTGKRASLVEQHRPNLFTTEVANVGPGETVTVEIEYQQLLSYKRGTAEVRVPLAITPRYQASATESAPLPATALSPMPKHPVTFRADVRPGFAVSEVKSLYHPAHVTPLQAGRYGVRLDADEIPADRDLVLHWEAVDKDAPQVAVFAEDMIANDYRAIMITPPKTAPAAKKRLTREVVFVVDSSGSMHGVSMDAAKRALHNALAELRPQDAFNIIEFDDKTRSLFDQSAPATSERLESARDFVVDMQADGGTEMYFALEGALTAHPEVKRQVRQVVFITDGAVSNEQGLFALIDEKLGQSRLFTVGIGHAPNSYFMTKAAEKGHGTFTYIADVGEVEQKMSALFGALKSPVLTDLTVKFSGQVLDMFPRVLPDLYQGEPILVTVRGKDLDGTVTVAGKHGDDRFVLDVELPGGESAEGVHKLHGRREIDALEHDRGLPYDEQKKRITEVALKHHLVSAYTSLVAVDRSPVQVAAAHDVGELPQGGLGLLGYLWAGLMLLCLGMLFVGHRRGIA